MLWQPRLTSRSYMLGKEARFIVKFLKMIMIVAVAAGVLSLGACAQKKETQTTSGTTATTGYSK